MLLTKDKFKSVLSRGNDINIFISDRGGYKSSVAQEFFIDDAMHDSPFILIRSKKDEAITANWLSEYVRGIAAERGLKFWSEKVNPNIQAIYFSDKDENKHLYCYGLWLSLSEKYKSSYFSGFEKVKYILWEECVPNNPLVQDSRYIIKHNMDKIAALLSIGSTITRKNKAQYIFFGNDIAGNIINPVTVAFNLLERIEPDAELEDNAIIDDRKYSFYFNYFDFPGAVNHWLINKELNVSYNPTEKEQPFKLDMILLTEFKKYYLYRYTKYIYISSRELKIKNNQSASIIASTEDFFKLYKAEHLLTKCKSLSTALTMLISFYNVRPSEISFYFGDNWIYSPGFREPERLNPQHVINIDSVNNMELARLMELENFERIKLLIELYNEQTFIFENIKIKMLFDELKYKLLFI